jgi:hypothetical protein
VITNLRPGPARLYAVVYCARGDSENRRKELHHDLAFGRTSCSRFWANQLRVLLTAAAYVLLQELQLRAEGTALARAQVGRLRLVLLKIGVRVTRSVRRLAGDRSQPWRRSRLISPVAPRPAVRALDVCLGDRGGAASAGRRRRSPLLSPSVTTDSHRLLPISTLGGGLSQL